MIFLISKNILYFKPLKVAGTSFHYALAQNAEAGDIVSPLGYDRDWGKTVASNWSTPEVEAEYIKLVQARAPHQKVHEFMKLHKASMARPFTGIVRPDRMAHLPPKEFRQEVGEDVFDKAHKVTIVRHPYTALVSCGRMENTEEKALQKIKNRVGKGWSNQRFYFKDGKPVCDTYLRYEHLREDIAEFEKKFNLEILKHMPHMRKPNSGGDGGSTSDWLTQEQKDIVYKRDKIIFDYFGYEPEGRA